MEIRFAKMHGAANDFVVVDAAPPEAPLDAALTAALCHRRRGVGADGALYMERLPVEDQASPVFRMHFYNLDGGRCVMCFNGARCCALRAFRMGWAGTRFVFETDYGRIQAEIDEHTERVTLHFSPPEVSSRVLELPEGAPAREGRAVDTGDPHLVLRVEGVPVEELDFEALARPLRWWEGVGAEGSNVHMVECGSSEWRIRSFERGVEAETWACGSGCIASVAALAPATDEVPIRLRTHGDDLITVQPRDGEWTLAGPAVQVFEASFEWEADA